MNGDRPRETRPKFVLPAPDPDAHSDGRLMHELTGINMSVSRYVLNYADADAGRAAPITPADERSLGDRMITAGEALHDRATRREQHEQS